MVKISVCIPIYGVEKYIEKCARSLFEQTLNEGIEFIFVDDCTTDRSVEILRKTLREYPERISQTSIIVHDKNKGIGGARRTALENAHGEYIIFCDSDDWVERNMYETMLSCADKSDADMVICGYSLEMINKSIPIKMPIYQSNLDLIQDMMQGNVMCTVWNKLVKREIWDNNEIQFPIGIDMWEDVNVVLPICVKINKLSVISKALYHYNQLNVNSYTHILNKKSLNSMVAVISNVEQFFIKNSPILIQQLNNLKLTVKLNCLLNSFGKEQLKYMSLYPEANSEILKYKKLSICWKIGLKAIQYNKLYIFNFLRMINKRIKGRILK